MRSAKPSRTAPIASGCVLTLSHVFRPGLLCLLVDVDLSIRSALTQSHHFPTTASTTSRDVRHTQSTGYQRSVSKVTRDARARDSAKRVPGISLQDRTLPLHKRFGRANRTRLRDRCCTISRAFVGVARDLLEILGDTVRLILHSDTSGTSDITQHSKAAKTSPWISTTPAATRSRVCLPTMRGISWMSSWTRFTIRQGEPYHVHQRTKPSWCTHTDKTTDTATTTTNTATSSCPNRC